MAKDDKLVSPSRAPIYRYTDGEKEWDSPHGEIAMEEISAHIERHLDDIEMVYHELLSDTVHIDVCHVKPNQERPYHTLITSGMSDLPMATPEGSDAPRYLELMMTLPKHWQLNDEAFHDENWYWPIRALKFLARFPHKYGAWLGVGHTIPNGDPPVPFANNTGFTGILILPPVTVPKRFVSLKVEDDKEIFFMSCIPLYTGEMTLKLHSGTQALLDRFEKNRILEIVDINRKNVAKKRFGVF
ncbi:MAG: suppressor of fused domain protein [Desulfatibacillum sp.]|nr:suppressor of fused domain protein [Desulfatibacillum sp.]